VYTAICSNLAENKCLKRRLIDGGTAIEFDESSGKIAQFSFKEIERRKLVKTVEIIKQLCLCVISYYEKKRSK
jgi:hypothetical protein